MRRPDNGLRPLFRQHLREGIMWTTVETGLTAGGVPDSNYLSSKGVEGWLEYKACDANRVKVRPEQIGWHLRRARYGGRSWFAIRKQHAGGAKLGDPVDELWMVAGCYADHLSQMGLACGHAIAMGAGGPQRWNWSGARALILGRVVL
jgi:hypothetical protein